MVGITNGGDWIPIRLHASLLEAWHAKGAMEVCVAIASHACGQLLMSCLQCRTKVGFINLLGRVTATVLDFLSFPPTPASPAPPPPPPFFAFILPTD